MSDLEQIVRPSTSGFIRPVFSVGLQTERVVGVPSPVTWGTAGNSIFDIHAHLQQMTKNDLKSDETKRTFDIVRVMNPDDETQHIDVEVLTEYQARNQLDKSRVVLKFATNTNTEDTEVIARNQVRKSPDTL